MKKVLTLVAVVSLAACSNSPTAPSLPTPTESPSFPSAPSPNPGPGVSAGVPVLVGAGDIAQCREPGAEATARLLDTIAGTVFTTGDNVYRSGTPQEFRDCYGPTWGRHLSRTRPVPGNHDYETPGAAGYYEYFGQNAGPAGLGYYSYTVGPWLVVALNSEVDVRAGSPQIQWLRGELASTRSRCTLAYFHRPLFSSGRNGDNPDLRDTWRTLYEAGVEVVLNGHDHLYERFAPQDPDGRADAARGIRQFTVGTGGAAPYPITAVRANSEMRGSEWGVLVLRLSEGSYAWEFVPAAGGGLRDSGTDVCR
jgi:3',5'-cyclic AMP phosphodiesterase CpdA